VMVTNGRRFRAFGEVIGAWDAFECEVPVRSPWLECRRIVPARDQVEDS
jgi:hypothetical protein